MPKLLAAMTATLLLAGAAMPASAKEYNKRTHIDPAQGAKVARITANARLPNQVDDNGGSFVKKGDVVNTGCGKLDIGRIEEIKPGQRVKRDIIITGDVINAPTGCRR